MLVFKSPSGQTTKPRSTWQSMLANASNYSKYLINTLRFDRNIEALWVRAGEVHGDVNEAYKDANNGVGTMLEWRRC